MSRPMAWGEEYYPKKVNVKARRNERISKTDDIRIAPK